MFPERLIAGRWHAQSVIHQGTGEFTITTQDNAVYQTRLDKSQGSTADVV
jgi:hypothetical protein